MTLVIFSLGEDRYALVADVVAQIVRAVAVARLPKAPAIVEGVVNVRGTLVPVLDVRHRFGQPPRPPAPDQHLLLAHAGARLVALRVDRAEEVLTVDVDAVAAPEEVAPGVEHVAGIVRLADGLVVIHDLERFLALDEARQLDEALGAGEGGA